MIIIICNSRCYRNEFVEIAVGETFSWPVFLIEINLENVAFFSVRLLNRSWMLAGITNRSSNECMLHMQFILCVNISTNMFCFHTSLSSPKNFLSLRKPRKSNRLNTKYRMLCGMMPSEPAAWTWTCVHMKYSNDSHLCSVHTH